MTAEEFTWRDGERTIVFADGALEARPEALRGDGWDDFELFTTERALADAPLQLTGTQPGPRRAAPGAVNEIAAELIERGRFPALVAFGGGRVIDTAKAIAAVSGGRVAAIPTTLSGAEMTRIHKLPDGHEAEHGPPRRWCSPIRRR